MIRHQTDMEKFTWNSSIFHGFWKWKRRRVIYNKSISFFPREFTSHNGCYIDEISTWNFDVQSIVNWRRCIHWEGKTYQHKAWNILTIILKMRQSANIYLNKLSFHVNQNIRIRILIVACKWSSPAELCKYLYL